MEINMLQELGFHKSAALKFPKLILYNKSDLMRKLEHVKKAINKPGQPKHIVAKATAIKEMLIDGMESKRLTSTAQYARTHNLAGDKYLNTQKRLSALRAKYKNPELLGISDNELRLQNEAYHATRKQQIALLTSGSLNKRVKRNQDGFVKYVPPSNAIRRRDLDHLIQEKLQIRESGLFDKVD